MPLSFITMGAPSPQPLSRRAALQLAGLAAVCVARPAWALKPGKPSKDKLLSGIREERTPEEMEAERERVAEERRQRLERQRELQAAADRKKAGLDEGSNDSEAEIESNLRGQYYYPTARKRYLPRVKLAAESIPVATAAARAADWRAFADSKDVLNDAALPLKLYASSLGGGGLNLSSRFIASMNAQAAAYERGLTHMTAAAKKKDVSGVMAALAELDDAIAKYRELGRLTAPDFGIGEIPTDNKVGSGFSNNNSALYNKNKAVQVVKTAPVQTGSE